MSVSNSRTLYERALKVVPSGVHSNARVRPPYPLYADHADGSHVWDVDGREYLDCIMGHGSVILGHNNPTVQGAVANKLKSGLTCAFETEASVNVAEMICKLLGGEWMLRFGNTGTEASLHSLRAARAITGRQKVAKPEGSYSGWNDFVYHSTWPDLKLAGDLANPQTLPGSNGFLKAAADNTIILPFNAPKEACAIIEKNHRDLAAVILEPVLIDIGYIPATLEYLKSLREITEHYGIILIFDELLTGFRVSLGGAQQHYGVKPDMIMLGKAVSNGYPMSVIVGKPEIMETYSAGSSTGFNGTFNGHQVSLAAAEATLQLLSSGEVLAKLQKNTALLQQSFAQSAQKYGVKAFLAGGGGHFQPYFTSANVVDYRSAVTSNANQYKVFAESLNEEGIIFTLRNPLLHHAISAAHSDEDIKRIGEAFDRALSRAAQVTDC